MLATHFAELPDECHLYRGAPKCLPLILESYSMNETYFEELLNAYPSFRRATR